MGINPTNGNQQPWVSGNQNNDDNQATGTSGIDGGDMAGHRVSTQSSSPAARGTEGRITGVFASLRDWFARLFGRGGGSPLSSQSGGNEGAGVFRFVGSMRATSSSVQQASDKTSSVAQGSGSALRGAFSSQPSSSRSTPSPSSSTPSPSSSTPSPSSSTPHSNTQPSSAEASSSVGGPSNLVADLKAIVESRSKDLKNLTGSIRTRWEQQETSNKDLYQATGLATLNSRLQQAGVSERMQIIRQSGGNIDQHAMSQFDQASEGLWNAAKDMLKIYGTGEGLVVLSSVALSGPFLPQDVSVASFVRETLNTHIDHNEPDDFLSEDLQGFAEQVDQARSSENRLSEQMMWASLASTGATVLSDMSSSSSSNTFNSFMALNEGIQLNNEQLDQLRELSLDSYNRTIQVLASDVFLD